MARRARAHQVTPRSAQAFDDCTNAASVFKLLEGFEGLLERGAIAVDLERKALSLLHSLTIDLRQVTTFLAMSVGGACLKWGRLPLMPPM